MCARGTPSRKRHRTDRSHEGLDVWWRRIISGQRSGVVGPAARALLSAAEVPYRAVVAWRNRRWDRRQPLRVACPVVSIGNLTVGGTGKTPMVWWLCSELLQAGRRPAIVSRGYKGGPGELNDEGRELARRLPAVPHIQSPDRYAAARQAIAEHAPDVIVLDDGFQHRRLARDLDIVIVDALCPWGYDHVVPRGLLREPLRGLRRADAVVLSRSRAVDGSERKAIAERAAGLAPGALWCEASEVPHRLVDVSESTEPLESLRRRRVAAFCGIGNPDGFRYTLEALLNDCRLELDAELVAFQSFPDHHAFDERDVASLEQWAAAAGADQLLCTEKDLVKIPRLRLGGMPLHALRIQLELDRAPALLARVLAITSGA